jgi:hypothetical protein
VHADIFLELLVLIIFVAASNSHLAERGWVVSTSRNRWMRGNVWDHRNLLRLVWTTQPRSNTK